MIERLHQIEHFYRRHNQAGEADEIAHARLIVQHLQLFPGSRDPYVATYATMWRRSYQQHLALVAEFERVCSPPASRASFDALHIEGRSGAQWVASILAYLLWRSGQCWRPAGHRFEPQYALYLAAFRIVKFAQIEYASRVPPQVFKAAA